MTDQEINEAIARKCGIMPCSIHGCFNCDLTTRDGCGLCPTVPNYWGDLNAMHEAEGCLDDDPTNPSQEWGRYRDALIAYCKTHEIDPIFAHANQRAEAFLRTFSLWKS